MIKLIAVDMRGTLLQSNNQIGEETKKVLKKAKQAGIKIVPASGRSLPGVVPYMKDLGIIGMKIMPFYIMGAEYNLFLEMF